MIRICQNQYVDILKEVLDRNGIEYQTTQGTEMTIFYFDESYNSYYYEEARQRYAQDILPSIPALVPTPEFSLKYRYNTDIPSKFRIDMHYATFYLFGNTNAFNIDVLITNNEEQQLGRVGYNVYSLLKQNSNARIPQMIYLQGKSKKVACPSPLAETVKKYLEENGIKYDIESNMYKFKTCNIYLREENFEGEDVRDELNGLAETVEQFITNLITETDYSVSQEDKRKYADIPATEIVGPQYIEFDRTIESDIRDIISSRKYPVYYRECDDRRFRRALIRSSYTKIKQIEHNVSRYLEILGKSDDLFTRFSYIIPTTLQPHFEKYLDKRKIEYSIQNTNDFSRAVSLLIVCKIKERKEIIKALNKEIQYIYDNVYSFENYAYAGKHEKTDVYFFCPINLKDEFVRFLDTLQYPYVINWNYKNEDNIMVYVHLPRKIISVMDEKTGREVKTVSKTSGNNLLQAWLKHFGENKAIELPYAYIRIVPGYEQAIEEIIKKHTKDYYAGEYEGKKGFYVNPFCNSARLRSEVFIYLMNNVDKTFLRENGYNVKVTETTTNFHTQIAASEFIEILNQNAEDYTVQVLKSGDVSVSVLLPFRLFSYRYQRVIDDILAKEMIRRNRPNSEYEVPYIPLSCDLPKDIIGAVGNAFNAEFERWHTFGTKQKGICKLSFIPKYSFASSFDLKYRILQFAYTFSANSGLPFDKKSILTMENLLPDWEDRLREQQIKYEMLERAGEPVIGICLPRGDYRAWVHCIENYIKEGEFLTQQGILDNRKYYLTKAASACLNVWALRCKLEYNLSPEMLLQKWGENKKRVTGVSNNKSLKYVCSSFTDTYRSAVNGFLGYQIEKNMETIIEWLDAPTDDLLVIDAPMSEDIHGYIINPGIRNDEPCICNGIEMILRKTREEERYTPYEEFRLIGVTPLRMKVE